MVGFAGALIGGALKGWGTGTVEEIKQKREEKLKELDRQFQSQESALTRDVQREQIAASERSTAASLAVQKSLGEGQQANALAIANLGEAGANARSAAQIDAQEKQANNAIAAAKDLAEFQAASNQKLNTKFVQVNRNGKADTVVVTPDGQEIPKLKGPDGKELDWVGPDASTDAAKDYQFMIANGFDPTKAGQLAFGAKDSDIDSMTAQFYDSFVKSSFTTPDETKSQQFLKMARDAAVSIANRGEAAAPAAPAAGTPDAATPAVPGSATGAEPTVDLSGYDEAKIIRDATAAARTANPEQKARIRKALKDANIDPAKVPGL
jgi:hypothetical protein